MSISGLVKTLKRMLSTYSQTASFVIAIFALWVITRSTADEQALPRILLGVAAVVLLLYAAAGALHAVRSLVPIAERQLRQRFGVLALEADATELRGQNRRLRERIERARIRAPELYAAGIAEGVKRERALRINPPIHVWPDTLFAEGAGLDLVIVGTSANPSQIEPEMRAPLVSMGGRPLGILEVVGVDAGGQITFTVTDQLRPEYWARIEAQSVDSPVSLGDGVRLANYEPGQHSNKVPADTAPGDDFTEEEAVWQ